MANAYKAAGVDVAAGAALVDRLKPLAQSTTRTGALGGLGGFGAVFDPKAAGFVDPLLITATDGVGTKLRLAIETGDLSTVGIDLVAMCVNDLIVQGAEPLSFLDYYATGRLDVEAATAVVAGIAEGCRQAGCVLAGGETAEMPGHYAGDDFDLAGFALGAVERDRLLTGTAVRPGDVVLGLASSGLHSNGFSLVRRLIGGSGGQTGALDLTAPAPFDPACALGAALLAPTRIYVRSVLAALARPDPASGHAAVTGLVHVTGGGLPENAPRILPPGLGLDLDAGRWPLPSAMRWLAGLGHLTVDDLLGTFNCGLGMLVLCRKNAAADVADTLLAAGETVFEVGAVVEGDEGVRVAGTDGWGLRRA